MSALLRRSEEALQTRRDSAPPSREPIDVLEQGQHRRTSSVLAPLGPQTAMPSRWNGVVKSVEARQLTLSPEVEAAALEAATPKENQAPLQGPIPDLQFTELAGSELRLLLGPSTGGGAYSKFHIAMSTIGIVAVKAIAVARDDDAKPASAVRQVPADQDANLMTYAQVLQEARMAQKSKSPLAPIDVLRDGDTMFLVYRLMSGTLADLRRSMPTTWKGDVVRYGAISQAARDAQRAHDSGIIHRDIKPANILFNPGGHFFLGDYGEATYADEHGQATGYAGTQGYTAPEVGVQLGSFLRITDAETAPYDATIDTVSLGHSMCDLFVSPTLSPFAAQETQAYQESVTRSEAFVDYHGLISRPDGSIDWRKVGTIDTWAPGASAHMREFDAYFATIAKRNTFVCGYVLQSMINPNPKKRASAEDARNVFKSQLQYIMDFKNVAALAAQRAQGEIGQAAPRTGDRDMVRQLGRLLTRYIGNPHNAAAARDTYVRKLLEVVFAWKNPVAGSSV